MHLRSPLLPPALAARIEWAARRALDRRGAPMNGQAHRQAMVREILAADPPRLIVETGTNIGATTEWLRGESRAPIRSCEIDPHFHRLATLRLGALPDVEVARASAPEFLRGLAARDGRAPGPVFFYLDAHWYKYLPLRDELEIIFSGFARPVVMIDDFRVPGDPGYGYDDYGPETGVLSWEYIGPAVPATAAVFYPARASGEETGRRRGCVVLCAAGPSAERLGGLATLRAAAVAGEAATAAAG
jgi:hypothetical protein